MKKVPIRLRGKLSAIEGYCSRMHGYLAEMFPLPGHLALAALAALGIAACTVTIQGVQTALTLGPVARATWNIFAILLLLRLMDELKDKDIDRQLFPERPLPSGRVFESDIWISIGAITVLYTAANLHSLVLATSALTVLIYSLFMFNRFFLPQLLKNSLPLTLLTHTPIVPLIWLQAFVTVADASGVSPWNLDWRRIVFFVGMVWCSMIGWEIARKIRSREEETAYVTYSQIFQQAGAVMLAAGMQTTAFLMGVYLGLAYQLGSLYLAVLAAAWAVCAWGYGRFLVTPNPRTSKLKPFATLFIFAVLFAQAYGFLMAQP